MEEADRVGKPALLMLSHCVPQDGDEPERARAWAMLRLVSRSHRVFLVCLHDGPVKLTDWRALRQHAERVSLESPCLVRRMLGRTIGLFDRRTAKAVHLRRDLSGPVRSWSAETEFDAVLCTHASLWRYAAQVNPRVRLCDASTRPIDSAGPVVVIPEGLDFAAEPALPTLPLPLAA